MRFNLCLLGGLFCSVTQSYGWDEIEDDVSRRLARYSCDAGLPAFDPAAGEIKKVTSFIAMGVTTSDYDSRFCLNGQLRDIDLESPGTPDFMVHLGDKLSSSKCDQKAYNNIANMFSRNENAVRYDVSQVFFTPGDKEWNNCKDPDSAWQFWQNTLGSGNSRGFGTLASLGVQVTRDTGTERLPGIDRSENFSFMRNGVAVVGINMVGLASIGDEDVRLVQNFNWVKQNIEYYHGQGTLRAAVIVAHASPTSSRARKEYFGAKLKDFLVKNDNFKVLPVLLVHASGTDHDCSYEFPGSKLPHYIALQVDKGEVAPPAEISVVEQNGKYGFEIDQRGGVYTAGCPRVGENTWSSSTPAPTTPAPARVTSSPTVAPVAVDIRETPEPTQVPTSAPTEAETEQPTGMPTRETPSPTILTPAPTQAATETTEEPTSQPTSSTESPTVRETPEPTELPTSQPTESVAVDIAQATESPTETITQSPTSQPTESSTESPTSQPTESETPEPTTRETPAPTELPTSQPTESVAVDIAQTTESPTETITQSPTSQPTESSTESPTSQPTESETPEPTARETPEPTELPTSQPTESIAVDLAQTTEEPTLILTAMPTQTITEEPTLTPTAMPTQTITEEPTLTPTAMPTQTITEEPTLTPTAMPTQTITEEPTLIPTSTPTSAPTSEPTIEPTPSPTPLPTPSPTSSPSSSPTTFPTSAPFTSSPTLDPQSSLGLTDRAGTEPEEGEEPPPPKPKLFTHKRNRKPEKLSECHGSCTNNDECGDGLWCFKRKGNETIPGCDGPGKFGKNYCFRRGGGGNSMPRIHTWKKRRKETMPLKLCEGDCNENGHCEEGLICMQRSRNEPVDQCAGTPVPKKDYCVRPPPKCPKCYVLAQAGIDQTFIDTIIVPAIVGLNACKKNFCVKKSRSALIKILKEQNGTLDSTQLSVLKDFSVSEIGAKRKEIAEKKRAEILAASLAGKN